jgi:hypothetical protein
VGIRVTLVMNQACSMNSRNWNGLVKIRLVTSTTITAISPGPRRTVVAENDTCPPPQTCLDNTTD